MEVLDPIFLRKTFRELVKKRYGIEEKFEYIENRLEGLRKGESLTYNHLEIIADRYCWPFIDFWRWPPKEQIQNELDKTKGWFAKLPDEEEDIIEKLIQIFKNISLVSIVLRFSSPDDYGIYSSPPLYAMQVERGRTEIEDYLNYIRDLRLIAKSLGVRKAADADMFVWAIAHRPDLLTEFNRKLADHLPKNISFKDLVNCMQDDPLKIAKVFNRKGDFQTAGLWAAKAFERLLNSECRKYPYEISKVPDLRYEMIETLIKTISKWKNLDNADLLRKTKNNYRNKIIPGINRFTQDDVNGFLNNLEKLRQISK